MESLGSLGGNVDGSEKNEAEEEGIMEERAVKNWRGAEFGSNKIPPA